MKPQYRVNLKDLQADRGRQKSRSAGYSWPRSFRLMTSSMVVVAAAAWLYVRRRHGRPDVEGDEGALVAEAQDALDEVRAS